MATKWQKGQKRSPKREGSHEGKKEGESQRTKREGHSPEKGKKDPEMSNVYLTFGP